MFKFNHITLSLAISTSLVACGGGGSSSTSAPTALTSAAYAGTWKDLSGCSLSSIKQTNSAGANLYQQVYFVLTPVSNTSVNLSLTIKHYAPTDSTCSGALLVTETTTSTAFSIDGTATIAGQTVDKITFPGTSISNASLVIGSATIANSSLGASAATINGYYFNAGHFSSQPQTVEKAYFRATASNIYCDDGTGTATAYPTGMDTAACFVKI